MNAQANQKSRVRELWEDSFLRRNLIASIVLWAMSAFNLYLLIFFLKYFPGNIYENSLCFAASDLVAYMTVGCLSKRMKIVNVIQLGFLVSMSGAVIFLMFSSITSLIPVFVCLCRVGSQMTFNAGYVSVPRLFPTKFQSTVYATVNFFAHVVACLSPMVAEIPKPVPFITLLFAVGISAVATRALQEID